jgi:D-3-phosphoglycerate dehydrogenase
MELYERQLGLVGLGRIGSHVARVTQALGMKVATYDPYLAPEKAASAGIELVDSLEKLLGMSDVVSLHLPLTDENRQFMNAERFGQMKKGSIFINTARGGHVDESALVDALDSGHLFGAGLDVTDPEPPPAGSPLFGRSNVVITPHIASATVTGKLRIYEMAMEEAMRVLRGDRPHHLVNPEVWDEVQAKWEAQAGE